MEFQSIDLQKYDHRVRTTSPFSKKSKHQPFVLTIKNIENKTQNHVELHKPQNSESAKFDDHICFKDQNKNLIHNEFKDCLNHNKIIIRPFYNKRQNHKSVGNKFMKINEEGQNETKDHIKLVKYQSSTISHQVNPQNQNSFNQIQSGLISRNGKICKGNIDLQKSINLKDFQNGFSPYKSRKNENSLQLNQKKAKELALKVKDKQKQKNHQQNYFLADTQPKKVNFTEIINNSKREHLNRRRRFSFGRQSKRLSLQTAQKSLRPIEIKSLHLNIRQPQIMVRNKKSKEAIHISKQMMDKMRSKSYLHENNMRNKNEQQWQKIQYGQQKNFRLGLYSNYLSNRVKIQQKGLKGWQVDPFNFLPQFI